MLYNAVITDSLVNASKYDFSKIRPVKLESTCKIAWPFVIRLDFTHFSELLGERRKVVRGRIGMHLMGIGGLESFKHPQKKVSKSRPYKERQSQTISKNCFQKALSRRFR